jgi:hypothetical protein
MWSLYLQNNKYYQLSPLHGIKELIFLSLFSERPAHHRSQVEFIKSCEEKSSTVDFFPVYISTPVVLVCRELCLRETI